MEASVIMHEKLGIIREYYTKGFKKFNAKCLFHADSRLNPRNKL